MLFEKLRKNNSLFEHFDLHNLEDALKNPENCIKLTFF